jgi:hypothetical protein
MCHKILRNPSISHNIMGKVLHEDAKDDTCAAGA